MVALGFLLAPMLILNGCSSGGTTQVYENGSIPDEQVPGGSNSSTVIVNNEGDGDITINQTTVTGNGTYLYSEDGSVSYIAGDGNIYTYQDGSVDEVSEVSGVFDPLYTESECIANGYFWCPLAQECMNSPTQGSSCSN